MIIQRGKSPKDRTNGIAILPDGTEFKTLERPWLDNKVGVSCIPEGNYKFMRDTHGRFQWFRVLDVQGRTNIEMHMGSKPSHSEGCILMSREALTAAMRFYGDVNLTYILEIRDA